MTAPPRPPRRRLPGAVGRRLRPRRLRWSRTPLDRLLAAPPGLNPALTLAWTFKRAELAGTLTFDQLIAAAPALDAAEAAGEAAIAATTRARQRLAAAPAQPARTVPGGF